MKILQWLKTYLNESDILSEAFHSDANYTFSRIIPLHPDDPVFLGKQGLRCLLLVIFEHRKGMP